MVEKGNAQSSPYQLNTKSIKLKGGQFEAIVVKVIKDKETINLPLTISLLQSGVARVTLDEEKRQKGDIELRHGSKIRKERYNEAAAWALTGAGLQLNKYAELSQADQGYTKIVHGPNMEYEVVIRHAPFGIEFRKVGEQHVVFNERGFMNMEHWRAKIEQPVVAEGEEAAVNNQIPLPGVQENEDESTWWEESFGGNTDTKPRGPESLAMDITFPGYGHVYGLAEHAGPLSLKETRGGDGNFDQPYRMYNSDVFEYELDSPMTLYGSIPFMQAHRKGSSVGIFWLNAAETWVDIIKSKQGAFGLAGKTDTQTHWMSESGLLDVFIMISPTPQALSKQYGELTGYQQLAPTFSLGYHQCRWNYVTDDDVKDVDRKMDKFNIPYDVIWLDIEYTDGKAYFTWDAHNFPDPISMEKQLDETQRKLVVIIDPHIKNRGDYHVVEEMKNKGFGVHNKDGNIFEGWCWPGSSHWVDAFSPKAREWWKSLFTYDRFKGTMNNVWLWNDMNEPSVFNGPEVTMPKDNVHYGDWEHRDLHLINGMTFVNATYHALLERKKGEILRPFVLTRSFYAGSQRLGAMWTGDNEAKWSHLAISLPMILNQGVAGFPFAGADIGGFFGNPSKELQTRWYQAGAFYPFMRGHAHIDTRRREPYLLGEPYTSIMTQAIRLRYALLPTWYTAFYEASVNGTPIVRPQYYVHPSDERGFAIDDQLYIGDTGLLAKPVVSEGANNVDIYLADNENYYDYYDYTIYSGAGKTHKYDAPLEKIPLLMQGGHIFPRKDRPRKSSGLMKWDPYTLVVVLGNDGKAEGSLYIDDGETFDFQQGAYIHKSFTFAGKKLVSTDLGTGGRKTTAYLKTMANVKVERVIFVNAPKTWQQKTEVSITGGTQKAGFSWHAGSSGKAAWATVRNPGVTITSDWTMDFS